MLKLPLVSEISLNEATRALLHDVSETARQIDELRPLTKEVVQGILQEMLGERVYSSNAIEGSTLTLRETTAILKSGHAAGVNKRREATEVINLGRAIDHAQGIAKLGLAQIPELLATHEILLKAINDPWAGVIRREQVLLAGATHQPPDASDVRELLEQLFLQLSAELDTTPAKVPGVVLAAWTHWAIARIHPFMDGNGRIARLWQDMILFHRGLTCAVIRPEDRREYYAALEEADGGEFNNLIQIVAQRVLATFDKYRLAKQRADEVVNWATAIAGKADTRLEEKRKLEYMRWHRRMEELYFEFERCAAAITRASSEIEVQVVRAGIVDQVAWEELRAGSQVSDTKFFLAAIRRGARQFTYYFFFGRYYWTEADGDEERAEPRVAVLISEQLDGEKAKPLYSSTEGTLPRQFFVMDDQFVRQRLDASSKKIVNDKQLTALQVAQEFFKDVVLRRVTP